MAKKKKEEIKKPDILITAIESAVAYAKNNLRSCIIGAIIVLAAALSVYAYTFYDSRQEEKVQYMLAQGIQNFDTYIASGKKDALDNAEKIFKEVVNEKRGQLSIIAKLYLGKASYAMGKNEEAKKLYGEVSAGSSNPATRSLAEKALEHLNKTIPKNP